MKPMPRLILYVTTMITALLVSSVALAQEFDTAGEQSMLSRINALRAARDLPPLTRNAELDAAAQVHCREMAAQHALSHVSDSSGTPADRVRHAGVNATTVAENVALHRSTDQAFQALVQSAPHLANMLSPDATDVGLAALSTDDGVYVTQVFAALAPQAQPQAQAGSSSQTDQGSQGGVVPSILTPLIEQVLPSNSQSSSGGSNAQQQAPAAQPAPAQSPPQAATVVPSSPPAGTAPGQPLSLSSQSNGTVVVQRGQGGGRVEGYWVYGSGRWWYYPMPANAQPGQRLQPDLSVQGPPPGYPAHPFGAQSQSVPVQQVPARPVYRAAPPVAGASVSVVPGVGFYSVPPPPMTGRPTRAWRIAHRRWLRAYRHWLRQQRRLRRRAL